MADLHDETIPVQKLTGRVHGLYAAFASDAAEGKPAFVSARQGRLQLTYEGIPGDAHAGLTRASGSREPWYERGTEMRNERQLSILSAEELADVAAALNIDELKPEWIGGNIVIEGVPDLTRLPARTQMFFAGGAVVRIDGDNGPCKVSGRSISSQFDGRGDLEFGFVQAAKGRRGLVGWVEKPGVVEEGAEVSIRIWPQTQYRAERA